MLATMNRTLRVRHSLKDKSYSYIDFPVDEGLEEIQILAAIHYVRGAYPNAEEFAITITESRDFRRDGYFVIRDVFFKGFKSCPFTLEEDDTTIIERYREFLKKLTSPSMEPEKSVEVKTVRRKARELMEATSETERQEIKDRYERGRIARENLLKHIESNRVKNTQD